MSNLGWCPAANIRPIWSLTMRPISPFGERKPLFGFTKRFIFIDGSPPTPLTPKPYGEQALSLISQDTTKSPPPTPPTAARNSLNRYRLQLDWSIAPQQCALWVSDEILPLHPHPPSLLRDLSYCRPTTASILSPQLPAPQSFKPVIVCQRVTAGAQPHSVSVRLRVIFHYK